MTLSNRIRDRAAAGLAAAALFLGGWTALRGDGSVRARQCCYTNPRYSGVCAVERAERETCASILAYLNNPRSQGKSYCGSTSIRGGWREVQCPAHEEP